MRGMVISEFEVVRKILRGVLYSADLSEVVLFESLKEGYKAIATEVFDVVLLDNTLSEHKIFEFMRELRMDERRVAIFIVAAETNEDFVLEAMRAGATGFIIRPFRPPVVRSKIRQALQELVLEHG